ncbi:hypothetical protein [Pedobacter faecalis]|uniref:hypothetical protein n=1 Tax=Pedobacter faecalis TaxID=3041495 RepID=UPI00254A361F|nr:hypothetical protein [Pedobacter sp. ELA7]
MLTLLATLWFAAWLWLLHEYLTAPILDDNTGQFIPAPRRPTPHKPDRNWWVHVVLWIAVAVMAWITKEYINTLH